jgi:hypothetical protein
MTLNQRVQGSSPCAPTIDIASLFSVLRRTNLNSLDHWRSVGSFCSPFELTDGAFGERGIAMQKCASRIERTSRRLWPVMVAMSASVHPARANRVPPS